MSDSAWVGVIGWEGMCSRASKNVQLTAVRHVATGGRRMRDRADEMSQV